MSIKALRNYEYAQANTHIKKIEKIVRKYTTYNKLQQINFNRQKPIY